MVRLPIQFVSPQKTEPRKVPTLGIFPEQSRTKNKLRYFPQLEIIPVIGQLQLKPLT